MLSKIAVSVQELSERQSMDRLVSFDASDAVSVARWAPTVSLLKDISCWVGSNPAWRRRGRTTGAHDGGNVTNYGPLLSASSQFADFLELFAGGSEIFKMNFVEKMKGYSWNVDNLSLCSY